MPKSEQQANGANARNVWTIPTQGRPDAHFATFPDELPRRCILAGTSERGVCSECGAPWERVVDDECIPRTHSMSDERAKSRKGQPGMNVWIPSEVYERQVETTWLAAHLRPRLYILQGASGVPGRSSGV